MALVQCYECSREISTMAFSCPGCGTPINQTAEEYYPNGQLRQKVTYKNGKKHGPFEMYDEKGEVEVLEVAEREGPTAGRMFYCPRCQTKSLSGSGCLCQ